MSNQQTPLAVEVSQITSQAFIAELKGQRNNALDQVAELKSALAGTNKVLEVARAERDSHASEASAARREVARLLSELDTAKLELKRAQESAAAIASKSPSSRRKRTAPTTP